MSVADFRNPMAAQRARQWDRARGLWGAVTSVLFTLLHPPQGSALSNLKSMPMTVMAAGCFAAAFYQLNLFWGLLATVASLVYLERAIADEEV